MKIHAKFVCKFARVRAVFVSVCITVSPAKRNVQECTQVYEHVLHGVVHRRVYTEDRRFWRQGELYINIKKNNNKKHQIQITVASIRIEWFCSIQSHSSANR